MRSKLQVASHLLIVVDFNIVISVEPYQNFHNIKLPLVLQTYRFLVILVILIQVQPIISSIFLIWLPMISSFFIKGECWNASQLLLGIPKNASQLLLGVPNHSLQGGEWWGKIDKKSLKSVCVHCLLIFLRLNSNLCPIYSLYHVRWLCMDVWVHLFEFQIV